MRKFIINVNGNSYEVEVDEISADGSVMESSMPRQNIQRAAAPAPAPISTPAPVAAPASETKTEVKEVVVSAGQEVVEAPMPGNIWKIVASEGQMVKAGDTLLILEAMKMENEILAPRDGKVVSISTSEGSAVNTGDKLVVIE